MNTAYDCGSDEAFKDKIYDPLDYAAIIWLAGDESDDDETVGFTEMSFLANYLRKGGQLLISGSNIGYDLDFKGSAQHKKFFNEYLNTKYISNGSSGNGYHVIGISKSIFSGLTFDFDDGTNGFNIIQPDGYDSLNGSIPCLNYTNGAGIAALQYEGKIGGGSVTGRTITLGFPCEAILNDVELDSFMLRSLNFFEIFKTTNVAEDLKSPKKCEVFKNYPNPFNASTTIKYKLTEPATIRFMVYNMLGQKVFEQIKNDKDVGQKDLQWIPQNQSSGIYYFSLLINRKTEQINEVEKMMYLK